MAALEALAHGIPVAAFAVGGLPELIEHGRNGWLVAPGDTAAMTATVAAWRLLPELARREMAITARATVASRYSPEAQLDRLERVYLDAMRGSHPQHDERRDAHPSRFARRSVSQRSI